MGPPYGEEEYENYNDGGEPAEDFNNTYGSYATNVKLSETDGVHVHAEYEPGYVEPEYKVSVQHQYRRDENGPEGNAQPTIVVTGLRLRDPEEQGEGVDEQEQGAEEGQYSSSSSSSYTQPDERDE